MIVGRTHPYFQIHPQAPTASLVSLKVLSSIIGQVLLTGGFQFWVFYWVRSQPWLVFYAMYSHGMSPIERLHHRYSPPIPDAGSDALGTASYESTVLFLLSSFQYILVAAVFSIGPPYRLPMWTNGTPLPHNRRQAAYFILSVVDGFDSYVNSIQHTHPADTTEVFRFHPTSDAHPLLGSNNDIRCGRVEHHIMLCF